jgi:hypothetical protein
MASTPLLRKSRRDPRDLNWARVCSVDSPVVVADTSLFALLIVSWVANTTRGDLRIKLRSMTPTFDLPWDLSTVDTTVRCGS